MIKLPALVIATSCAIMLAPLISVLPLLWIASASPRNDDGDDNDDNKESPELIFIAPFRALIWLLL